jgi:soluble lytic murein transglycosylase-like protein
MQEIQAKMQSMFGTLDESPSFDSTLGSADKKIYGQLSGGIAPLGVDGLQLSPDGSAPLQQMAAKAAQRYGIEPQLFMALINQESSFNPMARSTKGALGLSQLMPQTASELGVTNRTDPEQSLDGGAKYFSQLLDRFGTPELALAAYNAGPGAVEQAGGVPNNPETQKYVANILRAAAKKLSP